jgi:hypothetical protein
MLKKSASIVLASLRSSTYRSVRLASSLAAALLDSLFEHPAIRSCASIISAITVGFEDELSFAEACKKRAAQTAPAISAVFRTGRPSGRTAPDIPHSGPTPHLETHPSPEPTGPKYGLPYKS